MSRSWSDPAHAQQAPASAVTGAPARAQTAGPEADPVGNAGHLEEAGLDAGARDQAGKESEAPTTFATHEAALAHHRSVKTQFGTVLDQAIAAGLAPEKGVRDEQNLLHNSAEWVKAGNKRVTILTPTHDGAAKGQDGTLTHFDATKNWDALDGDYPDGSLTSNDPRLRRFAKGHEGQMNGEGTNLTLVNPVDPAAIRHTLIHEVQHDADRSSTGDPFEQKKAGWLAAKTVSVNKYQSEFRAFWLMDPAHYPPANQKAKNDSSSALAVAYQITPKFVNARQEAIFLDMIQWDSYRPYLDAFVSDPEFRAMVFAFAVPVGGNLVNSVRVEALSERLEACAPQAAPDAPAVVAALEAARALDPLDRQFLADTRHAAPFWAQASAKLSPESLAALRAAVAPT